MDWKAGRGHLGVFKPLLGRWRTETNSERGPVVCERSFETVLAGKYIELRVDWQFENGGYQERCLFGVGPDKTLMFWSFTSDGKRSEGWRAEAPDLHPQALAFEADMPAGRARQAYWPHPDGGLAWAVESSMKKGWRRFVEHRYERCE
jgi:hypothetical protein